MRKMLAKFAFFHTLDRNAANVVVLSHQTKKMSALPLPKEQETGRKMARRCCQLVSPEDLTARFAAICPRGERRCGEFV